LLAAIREPAHAEDDQDMGEHHILQTQPFAEDSTARFKLLLRWLNAYQALLEWGAFSWGCGMIFEAMDKAD